MLGVDAPGRLGRDARRALPGDSAEDVHIVRGEVDGHAHIPDACREGTCPPARDREDVRQPAGLEQPPELEDGGIEALDVADLDRWRARRRRGGHDPVRLRRRRRQRLLDEDRDAAPERRQGERQVRGGRGRDDDRVEVRLCQHRERLGECLGAGPGGRRAKGFRVEVGDGDQSHVGQAAQDAEVVPAHRAEADQPDAQLAVADRGPGGGHRTAARSGGALDGGPHGGDDGRLLLVGEAREHRQRQGVRGCMVGQREVGLDAALEDVRLAVDRDRVVDAGRDAGGRERRDHAIPVVLDGDRVLVEDVGPPGRGHRRPDRQVGEGRVIAGRDGATAFGVALELVQLAQPDRGRDVGQPEVVAEDLVAVALAHPLVPVEPDPVGEAVVVRGDEAALTGRHVLGAVQAERPVTEAAGPATAELRAVRLAGVLDDRQPVTIGDGHDGVHVRRQAEQVDRADRPGPRRDGRLDPVGIDQVRVGLDVDEDRGRAGVQDRADRRVEGVADGDDLVAGFRARGPRRCTSARRCRCSSRSRA